MTWMVIAVVAVAVIAVLAVLAYLFWGGGETTQLVEYRCQDCGRSFVLENQKMEGLALCGRCISRWETDLEGQESDRNG